MRPRPDGIDEETGRRPIAVELILQTNPGIWHAPGKIHYNGGTGLGPDGKRSQESHRHEQANPAGRRYRGVVHRCLAGSEGGRMLADRTVQRIDPCGRMQANESTQEET
jgi:hypothetical protein